MLIKNPGRPTRREAENLALRATDLIAAAATGDRRQLDTLTPHDEADLRALVGALAEIGASMGKSFSRPLTNVLDLVRMNVMGGCRQARRGGRGPLPPV